MKNMKRLIVAILAVLCTLGLSAQEFTGGVKGRVVSRADRSSLEGAVLTLYQGGEAIAETKSDADGNFLIGNLANGIYDLVIKADEYLETRVNVTVNDGYVKNMFNLSMTPSHQVSDAEDDNFVEFDMDDSGYNDNPTILFGQNDVFNSIAGFNFSAVRFRARGYSSESQNVYLAGVKMNDAITGYSPYSLWSGLNEATRAKDSYVGAEMADFGIGGYNGLVNINGNASNVRKGWRASLLTNSALYRLRLMLTYSSGPLDNGWSYAFSASARLGGNDWIDGVYYRSFGYYASAEKKFDDVHKLGFIFMATPGQRGAQNASTQEVYDLMGDNMYNSNWGYQNGKVRNARVRITNEPIAVIKYDFTPQDNFSASATVLYRFGKNGYTALDWNNAQDPRPDYYRNLPSYFWMENPDYNRNNFTKWAWATETWGYSRDPELVHVNWDRLYNVNRMNRDYGLSRSKYILEERRVDQRDLNLAISAKWKPSEVVTLNAGVNGKINRTEHYKIINDLLGGDYYLNVDSFAERDFSAFPYMIQNDLDYWMANGHAQVLEKGDKFGYDYYAQIRQAQLWASGKFNFGGFQVGLGGSVGYDCFWREGLLRKGLFPGLDDKGHEIMIDGVSVTDRDSDGNPITSKGRSKKNEFLSYTGKLNLNYEFGGGHRIFANAAYITEAPHFNMAYFSPRTRNSVIPDLTTIKTTTADLNYQYFSNGWNVRVTGFYTDIKDQSDVMSLFDDIANSFVNFSMSGMDQRHVGMELGFKTPTPVENLAFQGVFTYGKYVYTSNPKMYMTYDNSASLVAGTYNVEIPYWKSHPDVNGKEVQHYVPSTPQLAASAGFAWNHNYWFIDADVEYFDKAYLDMSPFYRLKSATTGPDGVETPTEIDYMASQEKFDAAWLLNLSVGKSWYIQRKYQIGFSLNAKNLLNNKSVKTGGYEQNRIVDNTVNKERYYRFDSKYFYMSGMNYMLNLYFRF